METFGDSSPRKRYSESQRLRVGLQSPPMAALPMTYPERPSVAGLDGWRRSADRAGLHINSLLTGNFTGNFAIIRSHGRYEQQETTLLQPFPERFPAESIRENSLTNRERKTQSRERRPRQSHEFNVSAKTASAISSALMREDCSLGSVSGDTIECAIPPFETVEAALVAVRTWAMAILGMFPVSTYETN
jgi:hypothetical protein